MLQSSRHALNTVQSYTHQRFQTFVQVIRDAEFQARSQYCTIQSIQTLVQVIRDAEFQELYNPLRVEYDQLNLRSHYEASGICIIGTAQN